MEEVTNQIWLECMRLAVEFTEKAGEDILDNEWKHMPIDTKRAICSQYLAKQMYDEFANASSKPPTEEG